MPHTVYSVDCGADLTGDSVNDCLASGKGGTLQAVNGHDGSLLWSFAIADGFDKLFSVYAGQFISDIDGDGVLDVLATHTEDEESSLVGHLLLISGVSGKLVQIIEIPDNEEAYYAPQILVRDEGLDIVLFGTGGQASAGGLYAISLQKLVLGDMSQLRVLYHDNVKGVMSPPVFADINGDSCEDIIVATFNSAVLAFDGLTFLRIWNYTFPASETFNSPTPTYFNDDDVPDFLVKYQSGPGFPVYFYSQTTVLDGRTGMSLLEKPIIDSVGAPSAALSVSVEGLGNDLLLYWSAQCLGHEEATDPFSFLPGSSIQAQRRADTCKMRFNSSQALKFRALNQHMPPPGIAIYSSEDRQALEYNNSVNSQLEAQRYLASHPDFREMYLKEQALPAVVEVPVEKKVSAPSSFRHKGGQSLLASHKGFYNADQPEVQREPFRGEEEQQPETGYLPDKYPNIRKHGDKLPKHPHLPHNQHWYQPQNHWRQNTEPGTYQDFNPEASAASEKLYENMALNHEPDYESMYEPRSRVNYGRPRDERNDKITKREVKQSTVRGIHRISSTGTLAMPLVASENSFEVIFATYWLPSMPDSQGLPDSYRECLQKSLEQAQGDAKYYGMDRNALEALMGAACADVEKSPPLTAGNKRETDPLSVSLGQMTVYRLRVSCNCLGVASSEKCSAVLPFDKQSWPSSMGADGKGYFKARRREYPST